MSLSSMPAVYRLATWLLACLLALGWPGHRAVAQSVLLVGPGRAPMPVVISPRASAQTRANASELARWLGRISGQAFEVTQGRGESGIVLGTEAEFAHLGAGAGFKPEHMLGREDYLLRSHERGLWVLGASDLAVQNGLWDLLHRLGFRHYFPGLAWEIVPSRQRLEIEVNALERPSYHTRRIWYSYGMSKESGEASQLWCKRNRCLPGVQLNSGHAYESIARAISKELDQHPEFLPLVDGQRKRTRNLKFELGNPALRALIAEHALAQVRKNPKLDSISMDPSDGGEWSQSSESARLGSVSDQALTLANEVAQALSQEFPDKRVGMYAYNYHSPPPSIKVHPQVVVSVATAFIKGDLTVEQLMSGWARQGATLGVREYYSVNPWDRDQPGAARGSNLAYLRHTIPQFHRLGARYMSAEASDNWGPNGLGYWLATRMLWDVREAQRIEVHVEEFLGNAFGPAKEPMRHFYEQLDGSRPKLVVDDQVGRMFRALAQARTLATGHPDVLRRLDELTLYARYCTLYYRYARASGPPRQQALEQLIRHAWRMRKTMMVHTWALYRDIPKRDKTIQYPEKGGLHDPEPGHPWKSDAPFTEKEFTTYLQEGLREHPLISTDFQPVAYSQVLKPARRYLELQGDSQPPLDSGFDSAGTQQLLTWTEQATQSLELSVVAGPTAQSGDTQASTQEAGAISVELLKLGGTSLEGDLDTLVERVQLTPADGQEQTLRLRTTEPGVYLLRVNSGPRRARLRWLSHMPLSFVSTLEQAMNLSHPQWAAYFYVPKGTQRIGLHGGEHGEVLDDQGRAHFWLNGRQRGFYTVEVPQGQDGRFWQVRYVRGPLQLLTVPPYFFRTPGEAVLPLDSLEQDAHKASP